LRLRATALALRHLRLRATALALRHLRLRATALALRGSVISDLLQVRLVIAFCLLD